MEITGFESSLRKREKRKLRHAANFTMSMSKKKNYYLSLAYTPEGELTCVLCNGRQYVPKIFDEIQAGILHPPEFFMYLVSYSSDSNGNGISYNPIIKNLISEGFF